MRNTRFVHAMRLGFVALVALLVLAGAACSGADEGGTAASEGAGSTPTPWPTRVERERVVSHRGGDKGCESFRELEEGIAAGAFADAGAYSRIRLVTIQISLFVNNAEPPITETVDALLKATEKPTTLEELAQPLADVAKACTDAGY